MSASCNNLAAANGFAAAFLLFNKGSEIYEDINFRR